MSQEKPVVIEPPASTSQLDDIRHLMRDFIDWHKERHADQLDLVFKYFNPEVLESELAALPWKFTSPDGCLLLATCGGLPAGCVAIRRQSEYTCEMKRMFVRLEFQGNKIGLLLANRILAEARLLGYKKVVLDSGAKQFEAHALYRKLGFSAIPPYYETTQELADWLVFMELIL